ncbi:universal stress protein [Curtobacterium sp. MCBD17_003]|uniref:universal stress protein n=1 Tax=Curtobacterium sp. MCBD17_003 TaxID=2175667 RepID=UPI000DA9F2B6|nr:universal stress protein [Curtobacterium sp. MCBD17_003]WIE54101.1 universal stress protein [Curtobacterium sp. MCBD17_003]
MGERYIVGFDDSRPSRRALDWALDRAARDHGSVVLAHVRTVPDGPPSDPDLEAAVTRARTRRRDVGVSLLRIDGDDVVAALLGVAEDEDLLVVGTHKTGHLHGRALGTRALALAAGARCSVVVVPDTDLRFRRGVVAGVGGGAGAAHVCETAAREAEHREEELVLVRALEPDGSGDDGTPLGTTGGRVQDAHPLLEVSARTASRPAAPMLLDVALGHALLVIGARHPAQAPAGYVGAVLHDVLINLTAPVLVTRHRDLVATAAASGAATRPDPIEENA